jgi:FMN-dependent NADH-azoreductase
MWNFGLPYKLKQLIDLVAQRNYLFAYDGNSTALSCTWKRQSSSIRATPENSALPEVSSSDRYL